MQTSVSEAVSITAQQEMTIRDVLCSNRPCPVRARALIAAAYPSLREVRLNPAVFSASSQVARLFRAAASQYARTDILVVRTALLSRLSCVKTPGCLMTRLRSTARRTRTSTASSRRRSSRRAATSPPTCRPPRSTPLVGRTAAGSASSCLRCTCTAATSTRRCTSFTATSCAPPKRGGTCPSRQPRCECREGGGAGRTEKRTQHLLLHTVG